MTQTNEIQSLKLDYISMGTMSEEVVNLVVNMHPLPQLGIVKIFVCLSD